MFDAFVNRLLVSLMLPSISRLSRSQVGARLQKYVLRDQWLNCFLAHKT